LGKIGAVFTEKTMKIKTRINTAGEVEVDENSILTFPEGILGFELYKRYAIVADQKSVPFSWLQCLEDPKLAFVVIDPFIFKPDYEVKVEDHTWKLIELEDKKDLYILLIVTIPEDINLMTANFQGPLLINRKKRLGCQAISLRDDYGIKHLILPDLEKAGKGTVR
jgi:flagellar assembly factor FliW